MRIGCLQFAPQVGDISNNINRADAILSRVNPQNLDLLVLPELAFSGYNFSSPKHIKPYLEISALGISSLWARMTALKYHCAVALGYPEKVDSELSPTLPECYNSSIIVSQAGETVGHYRKKSLYPRDEAWALEGTDGFFARAIPDLGNVAMGIGMDINPYRFESPWNVWEFTNHVLHRQANLVILSMAWINRQDYASYSRKPTSPDLGTLSYWVARFEPLIRAENKGEVIVIIASRSGAEESNDGSSPEGNIVYAGTSCVLGIEDGEVKVYGILGRGQNELLVIDTSNPPKFKLVAEEDIPIYEDKAQSREALRQDSTSSLELDSIASPNTAFLSNNLSPIGLEAAFGEIKAVSPVEPLAPHAFFSSSPSKRRYSISLTDGIVTPIASTMSSPLSYIGHPISPGSMRDDRSPSSYAGQPLSPGSIMDGRSPSETSTTSQELLEKRLDRYSEPRSASTPDSASSIITDWDRSPASSRPKQFIKIIPPSPAADNSKKYFSSNARFPNPRAISNLRHESLLPERPRGIRPSQPTGVAIVAAPKASEPPTLRAPQLPRSRNPSLTRPIQMQVTIASQALAVGTARAGIVVPMGTVQVVATRDSSVDIHRAGPVARRARSMSPPSSPATALWAEDTALWRESHLR